MAQKKKWTSLQSLIVIALILTIFSYIAIDLTKTKPQIKSGLDEVKTEYFELSGYLDTKIPEIDSAIKIQAKQLSEQGVEIDALNKTVKNITSTETK